MEGDQARTEQDFYADFGEEIMEHLQSGATADTAEPPAEDAPAVETEADTGDAARESVVDETGRHHDPETGKFVEKPGEDETEESEEQAEEPEEEPDPSDFVIEVDDEETAQRVASVLEKYEGDPGKALVALSEAQSLIGRKGNEAAQANAELEAVKAELADIKSGQQAMLDRISKPIVPITSDLIESDPRAAAEQAVLQDNGPAFEAAIRAWQEGTDYVEANPDAAQLYLERLALEAQMEELQAPAASAVEDSPNLDAEVQKVVEKHPDLKEHIPAIAEAAKDNPILQRALETGTPTERAQALEALTVIAKSRTGSDTSREALKRVQIRVKQEADEARAKARVVSASRGSAATASQPTRVDQFLEAFDAHLGLKTSDD